MFATPNGEKREDVRRATIRAKKYRARAAENLRLADGALIREVSTITERLRGITSNLPRKKNRLSSGGDGWLKPQGVECDDARIVRSRC
jgi:hypothetical protein